MVPRGEEHAAINWPGNTDTEYCFAIHSPNRVLYFVAENADMAKGWIEKVEESRKKVGVVYDVFAIYLFSLGLLFGKVVIELTFWCVEWFTIFGNCFSPCWCLLWVVWTCVLNDTVASKTDQCSRFPTIASSMQVNTMLLLCVYGFPSWWHKSENFWCSNIFGRPSGIWKLKAQKFFAD